MTKADFAKELMLAEIRKENGKFVTMRIIDRLLLLYGPLLDRDMLSQVAESINEECGSRSTPVLASSPTS